MIYLLARKKLYGKVHVNSACAAKDEAQGVREETTNGKLKRASSTLAVGPIVAERGDVCVC